MVQPITWRNIGNTSMADASRPLDAAQRGFNAAFNQFGDTIKQVETVDARNAGIVRDNNTQTFLNELNKFKTPEALQAAMQSGEIDRLRTGFGAAIDQSAARGAAEALLARRFQEVTQANQFADASRDRAELPIMDQIAALTAAGRTKEAQALLDTHNLRREAGLAAGIVQANDAAIKREREGIAFTRDGEAHRVNMQRIKDATRLQEAEFGLRQEAADQVREDKLVNQAGAKLENMSKLAAVSAGSEAGQAKINEYINSIKDSDVQDNARQVAAQLKDTPNMTVAGVLAGLSTVGKRDWFTNGDILWSNSNAVDDAVARAKQHIQSSDAINYEKRRELSYDAARSDYQQANQRLAEFRNNILNRPGGGAEKLKIAGSNIGDIRTLSDGTTYRFTSAGWVREYGSPNGIPDR